MSTPTCDYCGDPATLVTGETVYPHRPDLADRHFWQCAPCGAYVGCHQGTTQPFGRLANSELRQAKMAAHAVFDPHWRNNHRCGRARRVLRNRLYERLASELGIPRETCHIGQMDVEQCRRTVEICKAGRLAIA